MSYEIEIEASARRQIRKLSPSVTAEINTAIKALADNPRPTGCIKMQGRDAWRIRVGEYRVIYKIHDEVLRVVVIEAGHRRSIYRPS